MRELLSIPALEDQLSRLEPGETLPLTNVDFVRLFGVNGAALARLKNFAKGHSCITFRCKAGMQFKKLRPLPESLVVGQ
jgi:hypothetical protein